EPNNTDVPADAWTRACDSHAGRAVRGIPVGRAGNDAWPLRRNGQLWRLRTRLHRHAHRLLTRRIRDRTGVAHISRRGRCTPHGASRSARYTESMKDVACSGRNPVLWL